METQQRLSGVKLSRFVTSLLNHCANEALEDANKVQAKHEEWTAIQIEKEQDEEAIRQEYMNDHEIPRNTVKQQYKEFIQQKKELRHEWLRTQNHGDLFAWLRPTFEHDTTPMEDTIYTMYAKPKYL